MSGAELKEKLAAQGIKQIELARLMKVPQQNISVIFKSTDIKSGTLEKIAKALNRDMSFFYPMPSYSQDQAKVHNTGVINTCDGDADIHYNSDRMIEMLNEQLKAKDEQMQVKDRQIDELMNIIKNK